jgi:predicted nucleic acid-binding protein
MCIRARSYARGYTFRERLCRPDERPSQPVPVAASIGAELPHRSLDAIHLATAMLIRDDVDVLLTYDHRLATAAQAEGVPTATPV